jgi:L-threonylcarbamoyladenylate synthase
VPTIDMSAAVRALAGGEIVAYPTETFYGLGVDALDEAALERLCALKGREAAKAISLLVVGEEMLAALCAEVPPLARRLIAQHWPGPLTLALPARPGLPSVLVSDGCVAVRESPQPVARALVSGFGRPVTTTSANPAGSAPARTAAEVTGYFGDACRVLDGGTTAGGAPSTLARVRGDQLEVLRPGAIDLDGTLRGFHASRA